MISYIYIYIYDFGSLGYAENLCRGTIKIAEYSPNPIYIYTRNRTVRTPPKTFKILFKILFKIRAESWKIQCFNTFLIEF